ncbi:hypothetical protein [Sinorhizobium fredii]|nr:hypothetical protein [Sinorhizobium fredii]
MVRLEVSFDLTWPKIEFPVCAKIFADVGARGAPSSLVLMLLPLLMTRSRGPAEGIPRFASF